MDKKVFEVTPGFVEYLRAECAAQGFQIEGNSGKHSGTGFEIVLNYTPASNQLEIRVSKSIFQPLDIEGRFMKALTEQVKAYRETHSGDDGIRDFPA